MSHVLAPSTTSLLTLDRLGPSFGAEVIGLDVRSAPTARSPRSARPWSPTRCSSSAART